MNRENERRRLERLNLMTAFAMQGLAGQACELAGQPQLTEEQEAEYQERRLAQEIRQVFPSWTNGPLTASGLWIQSFKGGEPLPYQERDPALTPEQDAISRGLIDGA